MNETQNHYNEPRFTPIRSRGQKLRPPMRSRATRRRYPATHAAQGAP